MKQALTLILLAALLTSLTACGSTKSPSDGTTAASEDSTTTEPAETDVFENMEVKDYGGRTFNWLIPDSAQYHGDMWVEEASGEVYDDALYARNSMVQEHFGVKINPIIVAYEWSTRDTYLNRVRNSVQAGDNAYDLVASHSYILPSLILDKMLLDLNTVESLRLDKPWWSQLVYKNLSYNDQIYYMAGDISANILEFANVLFVNKRLIEDFKRESPYDLVREGKWTADVLASMIKDTSYDLDGNAVFDGNDSWGYIWHDSNTINNIHLTFGTSTSRRDGDTIVFNIDSEEAIFCAEYAQKFLRENPDTHRALSETGGTGKQIFMGGRAMFYAHFMYTATELRDMEDDFGILPFPKKDENQEDYITGLRDSFVGFCIPTDNKDPEFVGTIMEALCVSGSKNVIPAYYDVVLKVKTARDEDSADMLDIIKESVTVDFAYAYGIELDNMANIFYMAYNAENGFASLWESQKESAEAKLEALLENFE